MMAKIDKVKKEIFIHTNNCGDEYKHFQEER